MQQHMTTACGSVWVAARWPQATVQLPPRVFHLLRALDIAVLAVVRVWLSARYAYSNRRDSLVV